MTATTPLYSGYVPMGAMAQAVNEDAATPGCAFACHRKRGESLIIPGRIEHMSSSSNAPCVSG
jgi:hypothetical protein